MKWMWLGAGLNNVLWVNIDIDNQQYAQPSPHHPASPRGRGGEMFLCPTRYDWRDIMFPGCPSVPLSVCHILGVSLCVQRPAKAIPFQQIIIHALQYQHDVDVHLLFFSPWPPYDLIPRSCLTWIFFVDPHWWIPLCVQCPADMGRLQGSCNRLRLRLLENIMITITITITRFLDVIDYDYDYILM